MKFPYDIKSRLFAETHGPNSCIQATLDALTAEDLVRALEATPDGNFIGKLAYREGMERAAEVCEERVTDHNGETAEGKYEDGDKCAAAIRAEAAK